MSDKPGWRQRLEETLAHGSVNWHPNITTLYDIKAALDEVDKLKSQTEIIAMIGVNTVVELQKQK